MLIVAITWTIKSYWWYHESWFLIISMTTWWQSWRYNDDYYLDHMTPKQSFFHHLGMNVRFKKHPLITTTTCLMPNRNIMLFELTGLVLLVHTMASSYNNIVAPPGELLQIELLHQISGWRFWKRPECRGSSQLEQHSLHNGRRLLKSPSSSTLAIWLGKPPLF